MQHVKHVMIEKCCPWGPLSSHLLIVGGAVGGAVTPMTAAWTVGWTAWTVIAAGGDLSCAWRRCLRLAALAARMLS